jgi:hypothetical protein
METKIQKNINVSEENAISKITDNSETTRETQTRRELSWGEAIST